VAIGEAGKPALEHRHKPAEPESEKQRYSLGRAGKHTPIHTRPVVPASAGAEDKNPVGSSHYGLPSVAPRFLDRKVLFPKEPRVG
jgi:hypothetical protein